MTMNPKFELVGPPCRSEGCPGVLVMTYHLVSHDMFYECSECGSQFDREPAANKVAYAVSTIRQAVGGLESLDS